MKPSAFAPHGLLQAKGGRPAAEVLHESIISLFSDGSEFALATDLGSFVDCFAFTFARLLAKLQFRTEKLDRERHAAGAWELLPALEEEFGITPGPDDTLRQRRGALLAAMKAALGSRRMVLEQALSDLLGTDYIGLHVHSTSDVTLWPSDLGDPPMLLALPDAPRKLVRLVNPVSTGLGAPQLVAYDPIDPVATEDAGHTLLVGDRLVVGVDNLGSAETVEVLDVADAGDDDYPLMEVSLDNAHEPGALCGAMPFPAWGSSQRHIFVLLSEAAALDAEKRRKTHQLMARTVTGVTTWSVCPASGDAMAGPWTLGDATLGRLSMNPMGGTVSVP